MARFKRMATTCRNRVWIEYRLTSKFYELNFVLTADNLFSGLTTTLLRTLGIPSRSVTNFQSAHDTDKTMTIDDFVDENNEDLKISGDSVWNFHVWNEVWLKGTSHWPAEYAGWAAVDATPQEESKERF
jgi:transglutaminase-like putative cysteine protease